jgi:CRP/FNR family cyclic AMP-dependent transcriptional regulator
MDEPKQRAPKITIDMLRDNRLFRGIDDTTLALLLNELPPVLIEPGTVLITEGDAPSEMFVVLTGELEVLTHGGGTNADVRVALLGPGDWCGEMAILDVQPRSATVRTLAPSILMRLTAADVERHLKARDLAQYARLLLNVARELSRRLRVADRLIAQSSATIAKQYVLESMRPPKPV